MASNPYEVEHNIKAPAGRQHSRRPDMSSFTSHLHQISPESSGLAADQHTGPHHAAPTPVDVEALFRLLHDQMATLAVSAPSQENRSLLDSLMEALQSDISNPPERIKGVTQEYLDQLERVPRKRLQKDEICPICAEGFLEDQYPLVVELPCHGSHRFMLECVGPWLLSKGTCPMCRKDLTEKKKIDIPQDSEDEEDVDGLYG